MIQRSTVLISTRTLALLALLVGTCGATQLSVADAVIPALNHAQTSYVAGCGGCHGIQGISRNDLIPDLKDRAGYWLCTAEGRKYMVKLPNVALAPLSDAELADLMNFVAFDLGGVSAPKTAARYTASEITQLRAESPIITDVLRSRHTLVASLVKTCSVSPVIAKSLAGYQQTFTQ